MFFESNTSSQVNALVIENLRKKRAPAACGLLAKDRLWNRPSIVAIVENAVNAECIRSSATVANGRHNRERHHNMKATITALLAASAVISGLPGLSAPAAAYRKHPYPYAYAPNAYAPKAYAPYFGAPPWYAYSTYSSGFSPYAYSDGFGAYASSFRLAPRGYGFYGYGPDPDSAAGYGPYYGSNPWWGIMDRSRRP